MAAPVVGWLERRGVGRGLASALVLVGGALLAAGVVVLVLAGITSQADALRAQLADGRDTLARWLADLGVDPAAAQAAKDDASDAVTTAIPALLQGLGAGLKSLSSLVVFLAFTALSLFFLLKDSHVLRLWAERHVRLAPMAAHAMSDRLLQSMRGYFLGVTIVACFNAALVLGGALLLGVPLAGTIALVTFLGAYVPYLGAWSAGVFAVLVALGGAGPEAAAGMTIVQLLSNGALQQLIQPLAYGAALGLHPLAVLVVTIAGGSLFGAAGLILAAPLTSAATRIAGDLSRSDGDVVPDRPAPSDSPGHGVTMTSRTELYAFWIDGFDSRLDGHLAGALERAESGGALRIAEALVVGRDRMTGCPMVFRSAGGTAGVLPALTTFRLQRREGPTDVPPGLRGEMSSSRTIDALLELLPCGVAVVALRIEHRWEQALAEAVVRVGGHLLTDDPVEPEPHEDVAAVALDLTRREMAMDQGPRR